MTKELESKGSTQMAKKKFTSALLAAATLEEELQTAG